MLHKGSLLVTGMGSIIIPLRRKPEEVDSWFDPSCDISLPHTCAVICENDRLISKIVMIEPRNNLGPRMYGISIRWQIFDHRTRQIYWSAEIPGCLEDAFVTQEHSNGDYVLAYDHDEK